MRKRVERTLEELYSTTEMITEPEITPVLEGTCHIQGPVDESDHELHGTISGIFSAEKKFTFINNNFHMRVESGTCNVCSAPCSSCMHNNLTVLAMESKIECGSSCNNCAKEADSRSFICADAKPLYKSRICDESQHAVSEASNLLSASSSHDSYSENAESIATVRAYGEASEDVDMPPFLLLRKKVADQSLQEKRSVVGDCLFSSNSHITSDLCRRTSLEKDEELRGLECHGDNISCITGVKDSNIELSHHNLDLDKKNATFTSDVLLSREVGNTVYVEATDFLHGHENEERQSNYRRQMICPKEYFQKKCPNSADFAFSDKSDLAEVHLPNSSSSLKVKPPCSPSQNGYIICHNGDYKDSDNGASCQPHAGGEPSLGPQIAMANILDENKPTSNNGKSKENHTWTDSVKITDLCLENETSLDKGISSDEVLKSTTINKELLMPNSLVENSESEPELTDVKVCDICGDSGREELLAFCSRCSDGAEHTYCMRVMLHKVPEGDWLCEECQLKEDAERRKVDRTEKAPGTMKESKLKEDAEVKVDLSEKVSGTAKECKLKDKPVVKKGDKSAELVSDTSKECMLEDVENEKVDKSETVPGKSKDSMDETSQKFASTSNSKLLPKPDMKAIDPDVRRVPKGLQSPRISAKRHAESQDVISSISKTSPEISGECIEMGSPRKKPALSRESSFKNLDTGKAKVVNMPPSNGSRGFSRSQSMLGSHLSKVQAQLQPPHGFISRSSSFNNLNSKPKVKHLTESVPIKPKITRESSLNDKRKESLVRSMTKSASFKSIGSYHSNTESASKTQSIHQSRVEDPRSLKQVKEKNMLEKKNSSTQERSLTSSSPRAGTNTLPKMDMKTTPHDVKLNNMSESNNFIVKGSNDANIFGRNEAKKQSIHSSKILGSASLNAKGNNEDQRPCQNPKEGAPGSSSFADKLCNNSGTVQHRGVLQTSESVHQDDKTKESSISNSSRQAVSGGNRMLRCQRCNETGHATQFCSIDKLRSSALKPSSDKNPKDGNRKGNKWKDAAETTISKNRLHKNNRQSDQSEDFPSLSATPDCDVASRDLLSNSSYHSRNIPPVVGTSDGQEEISRSSDVDPIKTAQVMDVEQQPFPPVHTSGAYTAAQKIEASCTPESSKLNATGSVSDDFCRKHLLHMLPDQASELAYRTSAIPKLEFIWQGSLEVMATGKEPSPFDGIQAHLSTSASPKVLEVATKFPYKVRLEEVSWISLWPLLFQGISPDEHNIALFFFAKDVESYERSYSKLLEKMLKNDLALRGFINGVELLIFPSTKLPVHSQRWNRLFFLWGIFKGRGTDSLIPRLHSQRQPFGSVLNTNVVIQDFSCESSVVSDSHRAVLVENPENKSPRCDISPEAKALKSSTCVETSEVPSPKAEDKMCKDQDSPLVCNSSFKNAAYRKLPSEKSSYSFPVSHSLSSTNRLSNLLSTHPEAGFQMTNTLPCSEVKNDDACLKNFDFVGSHVTPSAQGLATIEHIGPSRSLSPYSTSSDCRKGMESSNKGLGEEEVSMKNEAIFYDDPQGVLTGIDHLSWEKSNRKRVRSCSIEAVSQGSGETTKSICETMFWKDKVNYLPLCLATEDEREPKKMCFDEVHASTSFREETSRARLPSKEHPLLGSFLNEQNSDSRDGDSGKVVTPDNTRRQAERFFFPVDPSPIQKTQSDNLIHILSSDDEDVSESDTPNLELALWGKQGAQKKQQPKEPAEDDDDVSASLSLSLAVPTPKKEWQRPMFKSEQHLQDRSDVNTALLLFGGFTDT